MLGAFAGTACGARAAPARAPFRRPVLAPVDVSWDRIIRRVVGLRPYRAGGFRLEAARLGDQVVIHNYGHGGGGITLSWGTAELAARARQRRPPSGRSGVRPCSAAASSGSRRPGS